MFSCDYSLSPAAVVIPHERCCPGLDSHGLKFELDKLCIEKASNLDGGMKEEVRLKNC